MQKKPRIFAGLSGASLVAALLSLTPTTAHALPSYARQTGQECAACHNGFPELTPYGRLFKLNGYVFPGDRSTIPPIAVMAVNSFTHTSDPQPGGAAPHYGENNNLAFEFGSLFYGGAIAPSLGIGAFIQTTYNHISQRFSWDNTDIRWAHATALGDRELVVGVTLNNNPTVTDLWNTTPAWRYPFQSSGLAKTPPTAALIEGGFAGKSLGSTAYFYWDRLVYAEAGAYSLLPARTDSTLGVVATGSNGTNGPALYWRVAVEPKWGRNSLEFGTFGLKASLYPGRVTNFGADDYTDIGVDTQYQYLANDYSFSLQASHIFESTVLKSSYAQTAASNLHDNLGSFHVKGTASYEQTYAVNLSYFRMGGTSDAGLYNAISAKNSPNSSGIVSELDWTPFNNGGPGFWPWLNFRLGLQYVHYLKFNGGTTNYDGNGANANGADTVYAFSWLAF